MTVDADGNPITADGRRSTPARPTASRRTTSSSDGGDGFATFKQGTNRLIGGLDIDSLRLFLQAHDPYTVPTTLNRISSSLSDRARSR